MGLLSRARAFVTGTNRELSIQEAEFLWASSAPTTPAIEQRINDQLGWYRAQTSEIPFHHIGPFAGDDQTAQRRLLNETLGTVDTAVNAISDRVSSLELEVVRNVRIEDGTVEQVVVDDHPAIAVLYNAQQTMPAGAQPLHTMRQQLKLSTQYLLQTGEAYFLKIRDGALGRVTRRLSIMPSDNVRPMTENGIITGYEIRSQTGQWIFEESGEIIRIWYPSLVNIYLSRGILESQALEYDARKFGIEHTRHHFETDATPKMVLEADKDADLPNEQAGSRFDGIWEQQFHGRRGSRSSPPKLPPGWKANVLDVQGSEEKTLGIIDHYDKHLLRAYRTPKSVLGDISDAPARAGVETAHFAFDLFEIKPVTDMWADAFTEQWIKPEYGSEYAIRFKPFVQEDKAFQLAQQDADLRNKVLTINEIRMERGLAPVSWGEFPVGTMGETPYTGEERIDIFAPPVPSSDAPVEDGDDESEGAEDEPRSRGFGDRSSLHRSAWEMTRASERRYLTVFRGQMSRIFEEQESAVIDAIAVAVRRFRTRALNRETVNAAILTALAPDEWRSLFRITVDRTRRSAYDDAGQDALNLVGQSDKTFIFTEEAQNQFRLVERAFTVQMNETSTKAVLPRVNAVIDEGIGKGESIQKIAAAIRAAVGEGFTIRRNQSETIARTEVLRSTSAAQIEGYEQSGVVQFVEWGTSLDDRVRDSHRIDGQIRNMGDLFDLGNGLKARFPRDPALPAGDAINCRCFTTPITASEAAGVAVDEGETLYG